MNNFDFFKFNMPKIEIPKVDLTAIDFNNKAMKEMQDIMFRENREKNKREVENNESLKSLVSYNEDIVSYNKQLVGLNEKILNKLNSVDDTLLFLHKSFIDKATDDKESNVAMQSLLLQLITIMDSGDGNKVAEFLGGLTGSVASGLIVSYLQLKLGITI